MRSSNAKNLLILLLLFVLTLAAAAPVPGPHGDAGSWMARLEDDRSIRTLSIPGTHDSGALYSFAGLFGKCQTLSIPQQLTAGVRFLDIRLRLVDGELMVYHNFVEQKTRFPDLLDQLVAYLREHPTEFLLVSFKEEGSPIRSEGDFAGTLEAMLLAHPDVISRGTSLPETVGQARGKLHILARYENATMGVPCWEGWESNTSFELNGLYIQDHYKLSSAEEKLPDITAAFEAAASGNYALVLNHSSCYLDHGFPPSYAGTPAHTINPWLQTRYAAAEHTAGVLACDFITSELSAQIIGRNFS